MQKITLHLSFDNNAEEAAKFYTSIFKNSKIKNVTTLHNTPSGTVEIFTVELMGQEFTLINAGPLFKFNPSVSFLVLPMCDGRISHYSIRKKSFIL
jgi:predicted 3-demethylubiquinone-9 3-methyltransferase (glyoxalase superfamily)